MHLALLVLQHNQAPLEMRRIPQEVLAPVHGQDGSVGARVELTSGILPTRAAVTPISDLLRELH